DRLLVEAQVFRAHLHRWRDEGKVRVVGDERLGKNDEFRSLSRSFFDLKTDLLGRACSTEKHRGDLNRCGSDDAIFRHGRARESVHIVQVLMMNAPSLRCSRIKSSTSKGLMGRMPSIREASPCP